MMDWQAVRDIICEARHFTTENGGCRVLSDVIMPSGTPIFVHMRPQGDHLLVHDGGAAFDEIVMHGVTVHSSAGVRRMLAETNYKVSDEGLVFAEHVPVTNAGGAIAFVADASIRAAHYMLERASPSVTVRLDRVVQDALRLSYPSGRKNFIINGKHRQHRFDFGFSQGDEVVLVDAVTPDVSSVNAAVVKAMDVRQSTEQRIRPILVFDAADNWKSDLLNLLTIGGSECVTVDAVKSGELLAA